ncbi:polyadenylate-binding protein-interacting protein 2 [Onthophagus taurus]|uniref:polyadenylate-binding protein-interacting protein 2 n=1 Tax=Onthophagus taurus TaxID=166361 RepID=UPI000C20F9F8|nr:polyadenylate-binding protein-interacting protein 2 [Onthophagus taurus]
MALHVVVLMFDVVIKSVRFRLLVPIIVKIPPTEMKVPPTNINGFEAYSDEAYISDGITNHLTIANGTVEEYSPPVQDSDFSEYMWMENEEEFDKEVMQRLEEEELMEQCMLQHMMDDQPQNNAEAVVKDTTNGKPESQKPSTLNPDAAEFVPSWGRQGTSVKETSKSS